MVPSDIYFYSVDNIGYHCLIVVLAKDSRIRNVMDMIDMIQGTDDYSAADNLISTLDQCIDNLDMCIVCIHQS